ncbi:MAG: thioredoxin family protein [Myxococcota bacterium]
MRVWALVAIFLLACDEPVQEAPQVASERGAPPEVQRPYDENADADAEIRAALERAGEDKRVLLMFGANWCPWCRRLEHVFRNNVDVSAKLRESFEVVHVNTGARGTGVNAAVNERYGNPLQHGLPVLVVLDGRGEVVRMQETGSLESGDRHDPARVLAFLGEVSP